MKLRDAGLLAITAFVACFLATARTPHAQNAYITNFGDNTVSVIDTTTNAVTATIPVGTSPVGVAVSPDGRRVYTTNTGDNSVSVIDTATNTVIATIPIIRGALRGLAVTPDGSKVYVARAGSTFLSGAVSVIDAATNTVTATIAIATPFDPSGVAVSPDGTRVYVANGGLGRTVSVIATATEMVIATIVVSGAASGPFGLAVSPDGLYVALSRCLTSGNGICDVVVVSTSTNTQIATIRIPGSASGVAVTPDGSKVYVGEIFGCSGDLSCGGVSVIDTESNTVLATIPVGRGFPVGVAVTPDGSKVYVANSDDGTVSVIDTATMTVIATIPVGNSPMAFGVFIPIPVPQPTPVAGNLCNGIYDGAFNGNLTVSAGQDCIFLNGKITGNVNVAGGNFALNGATVGGNVTISGGGSYTLGPSTTIGGNLKIQNIPPGSANNSICGTTINGNMQLDSNGTAVQMGSTAPLFCAGNAIVQNLEVVDNSSSALMLDNSVGGNMSVLDNTGPVDVVGNTIRGNLLCQGNTDLIMGGGNMAKKITGQCSPGTTAAAAQSLLVPNGGDR